MPREISIAVRLPAAWPIFLCLLLAGAGLLQASAFAGQLTASIDVPRSTWKLVRLKNMPQGTRVSVDVESSGSLRVAFAHRDGITHFPAAITPEFQGKAEKKLSFRISIRRAGDYYLVLDNREGGEIRSVRLLIRAEQASPDAASTAPEPGRNDGQNGPAMPEQAGYSAPPENASKSPR
jgi:hypothetical protein